MDEQTLTLIDLARNAGVASTNVLNRLPHGAKSRVIGLMETGGEIEVRVRLGSPPVVSVLLFSAIGESVELGSVVVPVEAGH